MFAENAILDTFRHDDISFPSLVHPISHIHSVLVHRDCKPELSFHRNF